MLPTQKMSEDVTIASENCPLHIFVPARRSFILSPRPFIRSSSRSAMPTTSPMTMQMTTMRMLLVPIAPCMPIIATTNAMAVRSGFVYRSPIFSPKRLPMSPPSTIAALFTIVPIIAVSPEPLIYVQIIVLKPQKCQRQSLTKCWHSSRALVFHYAGMV